MSFVVSDLFRDVFVVVADVHDSVEKITAKRAFRREDRSGFRPLRVAIRLDDGIVVVLAIPSSSNLSKTCGDTRRA